MLTPQHLQVIERISRIVRDRGNVELLLMLDRIIDKETDEERIAALGTVMQTINAQRKGTGT